MSFAANIFHQAFWGVIAFPIFYLLFQYLICNPLRRAIKKRKSQEMQLIDGIEIFTKKIHEANLIIKKITEEEIPNNKNHYINKRIEFVLEENELKIAEEEEKCRDKLLKKSNEFDLEKRLDQYNVDLNRRNEDLLMKLKKIEIDELN